MKGRRSGGAVWVQHVSTLPKVLLDLRFHLRILREGGVVTTERRGPFVYYRLAVASLPNLLEACAKYAETLHEARPVEFQWPPWASMCRMMTSRRR